MSTPAAPKRIPALLSTPLGLIERQNLSSEACGDANTEMELYRHGIPYRLERAGGRFELRPETIFVTFIDSQKQSGGFEVKRSLPIVAIKLTIRSLELLCNYKLDWRTFPESIQSELVWQGSFELTSWFTDDDGQLTSKPYSYG